MGDDDWTIELLADRDGVVNGVRAMCGLEELRISGDDLTVVVEFQAVTIPLSVVLEMRARLRAAGGSDAE